MERLLADAEAFSGVKYDINNLGDVYEAIHVIQGELGLTGVAAGEASTTLQGSAGAMKASWENLMAAMTTGEGFEQAMANLGKSTSAFAGNVLRMLGSLGKQMPALIKGLAKTALQNAPSFIASGAELMVKLAVGVVQGIPKVIAKLPQVFSKAKSAFAGYDWAALGREAIQGIAAGLSAMADLIWEAMKSIAKSAWSTFKAWILGEAGDGGGGGGASGGGVRFSGTGQKAAGRIAGNAAALSRAPRPAENAVTAADLLDVLRDLQIDVDVVLEGDAGKIFRVVKKENHVSTMRTGSNLLAARG